MKYQSPRDYAAANFASRTMRWTGIIIALFLIFHLLDQTWGPANPDFVRGDAYNNLFYSFERVPVAIVYIIANIALGHPHLPRLVGHVPRASASTTLATTSGGATSRRASPCSSPSAT